MWLVEPWVQQLQAGCRKRTAFASWMWEPRVEASWDVDEDADAAELGGDDDRERDAAGADPEEDAGENDVAPDEAGGVDREAQSVDGFWDTDRVRRVMYRETASRIGITIGVALWRQAYPAIQREMCRNPDVRPTLDEIYATRPSIATAPALWPRCAHSRPDMGFTWRR